MSVTQINSSPIPLYLQIADTFRDRIRRGVWKSGDCIPTLEKLAADFQVARVTVRQAIQLLTAEGTLAPQRGRGTFVTARQRPLLPIKMVSTLEELGDLYRSTVPELLTIDTYHRLPTIGPGQGKLATGYTYMKRIHSHDGEPYCVISIYLESNIFESNSDAFRTRPVIPLLLDDYRDSISEAHQVMTIELCDPESARLLRIAPSSPVARVHRVITNADGMVVYFAEVIYRGDAVCLEINLKGSGPVGAPKLL